MTPQIAKRAYELYGERDHSGGTAVQDWKKAEQEIRNKEDEKEPLPTAKAEQPKPETEADEPKPGTKTDQPKPEAKDKTQPDVSPQLVKRVHEFYEELGREDVQAVQEMENSVLELEKHEAHK